MKTSSMLFPLERLSEEVLELILAFIPSTDDLARVARVSKRFNRLVLPYLYEDIAFYSGEEPTKNLRSLTSLTLQKPELAALVKSVSYRSQFAIIYEEPYPNRERATGLFDWPEDLSLDGVLEAAARKHDCHTVNEGSVEKWVEVVKSGHNEAAILAMWLPMLPNLQYLDIPFATVDNECPEKVYKKEYMISMLQLAAENQRLLRSLTDVIVPGIEVDYTLMTESHTDLLRYANKPVWLAACARLPLIRRLYGFNQGDETQGYGYTIVPPGPYFEQLQPRSSNVELIELRHSRLSIVNFECLLKTPKCLKTLIYEIGNILATTDVSFAKMQKSIEWQRECLERLSLGYTPQYFIFGTEDQGYETQPMSFSGFTSLTHLKAALVYIYGQDVLHLDQKGVRSSNAPLEADYESTKMWLMNALPAQLQKLDLIQCNDPSGLQRLAISLRELCRYRQDRFPHLTEVTIHSVSEDVLDSHLAFFQHLPWDLTGMRLILKVGWKQSDQGVGDYRKRKWGWDRDQEWRECFLDYEGPIKVLWDSSNS